MCLAESNFFVVVVIVTCSVSVTVRVCVCVRLCVGICVLREVAILKPRVKSVRCICATKINRINAML